MIDLNNNDQGIPQFDKSKMKWQFKRYNDKKYEQKSIELKNDVNGTFEWH